MVTLSDRDAKILANLILRGFSGAPISLVERDQALRMLKFSGGQPGPKTEVWENGQIIGKQG